MPKQESETIAVGVTDEGRVSITTASTPPVTVTASPKAARKLAQDLMSQARAAETKAAVSFLVVGEPHPQQADTPLDHRKPRSGASQKKSAPRENLKSLVASGHLHVGERICAVYPAHDPLVVPAWLEITADAHLITASGEEFTNPSGAVRALFPAAPISVNGWGVLKASRDGAPVRLSELKGDPAAGRVRQRTDWGGSKPEPSASGGEADAITDMV